MQNTVETINKLVDMADFTCVKFDSPITNLTLQASEEAGSDELNVRGVLCKNQVMASVESSVNGNAVKLIFPTSLEFSFTTNDAVFTGGTFNLKTMDVDYKQKLTNERTGRIILADDDIRVDKLALLAQALDINCDIGIPMPVELERLLVEGLNSCLQDDLLNKQDIMSVGEDTFVANATEKLVANTMKSALGAFTATMSKW